MSESLKRVWQFIREATGDDAYERYLAHHGRKHLGQSPMSRGEYFRSRQNARWSKVSRCC